MLLLKVLAMLIGAFLVVWPLSLRRLSKAQQPAFSKRNWFWIIPYIGGLICLTGFGVDLRHSWMGSLVSLVSVLTVGFLLLRHDQYSTVIRILFHDYARLRRENPGSNDFDLLYSIVKSRRPLWKEDRILEFCVGKSINQVVLLLLIMEYEIHPLDDMELYQRLKNLVEQGAATLKPDQPDPLHRGTNPG